MVNGTIGTASTTQYNAYFDNEGTIVSNDDNESIYNIETNLISVASFNNTGGTIDVLPGTGLYPGSLLDIEGYNTATVDGGFLTGGGELEWLGGQAPVTFSGGVTSNVSNLVFKGGTFDIKQDFTQQADFGLANADLALTDGTNDYTMTVTDTASLSGTLTAGTRWPMRSLVGVQ